MIDILKRRKDTEIYVMQRQRDWRDRYVLKPKNGKDCRQHWKLRKAWNRFSLGPQREQPGQHLDSRFLASRTVRG